MPGAIHNYWLGIMALAFALAIATWIGLVFRANRHPGGKAQESWPHRDVMGGAFSAMQGGRQVTPDPRVSPQTETERRGGAGRGGGGRRRGAPRPPAPPRRPAGGGWSARGRRGRRRETATTPSARRPTARSRSRR